MPVIARLAKFETMMLVLWCIAASMITMMTAVQVMRYMETLMSSDFLVRSN